MSGAIRNGHDTADGERRQLTVVFCDVADSMGLSERHDAEDVREILQRFQTVCINAVESFGGTVSNYLGDGVLAQFGWPVAIEKGPIAAVRAALAILSGMQALRPELERQFGERPHVRIGIQTGMVVIGEMGDDRFRLSGALVGEAPNVAARLQAIAPADAIVVGDATLSLLEDRFELCPLGPQTLRGLSRKIAAYEILGERSLQEPAAAHPRHPIGPFVERDDELGFLVALWREAAAGKSGSVIIVGEAGIGKSRLVRELRVAIGNQSCTEARLFGSVHHKNVALHPFIEYVRQAVGGGDPAAAAAGLQRLIWAHHEPAPAGDVVRHLEQLALGSVLLSSDPRDRVAAVTPEARRSLHGLLRTLALRQGDSAPLLLTVEDAHWLDPSSWEIVVDLLASLTGRPMLMVLTSREEWPPAPGATSCPSHRIALGRLSETACRSIIDTVVGGRPAPEPDLRAIAARSDGSPLFAEELALAYVETGAFRPAALAEREDPIAAAHTDTLVPAALHDSLLVRLEHLGHAKQVAQVASVLGRTFSRDLLESMQGPAVEHVHDGLSRLLEARIIEPAESGARAWFRFKHALLRDAAYQSMLRKQRRALHAKAALAIEAIGPTEAQVPDLLAQHWAKAGDPVRAAQWGLKAARLSAARSSNLEAMSQVGAVFEQAAQMPEGDPRDEIELEACIALLGPLIAAKGYGAPDVARITENALALFDRHAGGQADPARIFPVLYCQWSHKLVTGQVLEAQSLARKLLDRAEMQKQSGPILIGRRLLGTSIQHSGGPPREARAYFEAALELYNRQEHAALAYVYGSDFGIMSKCHLALSLWLLGSTGRANELSEEAQRDAIGFGHANTLGYALTHLGMLKWLQRDLQGVAKLSRQILDLSKDRALPFWGAIAQIYIGSCETSSGEPKRGLLMIRDGLEFVRKLNLAYGMPSFLMWLAQACARTGDLDGALRHANEALAVAETGGEQWFNPETLRFKASLLIAVGADPAEAVSLLRRSIEFAAERNERSFELRSTLDLARLLVKAPSLWPDPVAPMLERALAPFASEPVEPDHAEARALLNSLCSR